jgi:hypothetical protein
MTSLSIHWPEFTLSSTLDLAAIFLIALLANRFLRVVTNLIVKPAATQSRTAQVREQQTRTLAGVLYSAGSKVVWLVALLTAVDKVGINPTPRQRRDRFWRTKSRPRLDHGHLYRSRRPIRDG